MFAIIKTGGKQYRVQEGDLLEVEKLPAEPGQKFHFSQVLLIGSDEETLIGTPLVEKALVRAEVIENFKDEKVIIFKKKRRKQYRRTRGHRQELTRVKIEKIIPDATAVPAEEVVGAEPAPKDIPPSQEAKAAAEPPAAAPAEKTSPRKGEKEKGKKAAALEKGGKPAEESEKKRKAGEKAKRSAE